MPRAASLTVQPCFPRNHVTMRASLSQLSISKAPANLCLVRQFRSESLRARSRHSFEGAGQGTPGDMERIKAGQSGKGKELMKLGHWFSWFKVVKAPVNLLVASVMTVMDPQKISWHTNQDLEK